MCVYCASLPMLNLNRLYTVFVLFFPEYLSLPLDIVTTKEPIIYLFCHDRLYDLQKIGRARHER